MESKIKQSLLARLGAYHLIEVQEVIKIVKYYNIRIDLYHYTIHSDLLESDFERAIDSIIDLFKSESNKSDS